MRDKDFCFWILLDGSIVTATRHIAAVIESPETFGESQHTIEKTFRDTGEQVSSHWEGKAREEVLRRVIGRNYIRIRKNIFRNNQSYSCQLHEITPKRRDAIRKWARIVIATATDKYADVTIHQLKTGEKETTTLLELTK
jgi:hypothetical protein